MREIICLHIGQAGVQLSCAIWELFCAEHGVQADGKLNYNLSEDDSLSFQSFFQEVPTGQFVPRAMCIDMEPSVLDEIRRGPYRKLFHPDQLISGLEDAANNFGRGHYSLGKDHIENVMHAVRKIVNMCMNFQGFIIFISLGGGCGSGFGSLVIDRLYLEFAKKIIFQVAVLPSDSFSTATVEPYNTLLNMTYTIDKTNLCNFFDNEAIYNICCNNLDILRPTYSNLNRIVSQLISSMTTSIRFQGSLNADLDQIITNLVPYPRIHFPILTHAPIVSNRKGVYQQFDVGELTRLCFEPKNQLLHVDMAKGKYMCCCLQYRGDINLKEVHNTLFDIKQRIDIKFVDWCPRFFKIGINSQTPFFIPGSNISQSNASVTSLTISSAISQKFLNLTKKFDILFSKRSFLHWYIGEGMEEIEVIETRDEMSMVMFDYFECCLTEEEERSIAEYQSTINKEENKEIKVDLENKKEEQIDTNGNVHQYQKVDSYEEVLN